MDPYLFEPEPVPCPCCNTAITMHLWEAILIDSFISKMWAGATPPVLCVNEQGQPVRYGYAATWRCCRHGLVDVGVLAKPGDWKHGWWWPLGRVLWEVDA